MRIFVTGAAGFIGFHLSRRLLHDGHKVFGFDGLTPYYDVQLKRQRLLELQGEANFQFLEAMLEDQNQLRAAVAGFCPDVIVHLAAQAGVRYSLEAPEVYLSSNVIGTFNLLEAAKAAQPEHLLIASTSSVYGGNESMPFAECDRTDFPVSLYAATKKSCESLSHVYAHLWRLPTTCFRFFTVYGTSGRPDMALFKFVAAMRRNEAIDVYGQGRMRRDSTYVGDLVEGITRLMSVPPRHGVPVQEHGVSDSLSPVAPWRVVNIAGGAPVELLQLIEAVEAAVGHPAEKRLLPMQQGDVVETYADTSLLAALTGFIPATPVQEWVREFVEWYEREYDTPDLQR